MSFVIWNPWHGCRRKSEGCLHCYMYRRDESVGKDPEKVEKTASFGEPLRKKRDGSFALPSGSRVYACMTSDFFLAEADAWREEAWRMIRQRPDLRFTVITKRIERFEAALPEDWGGGYENVTICVTAENQRRADERLPLLLEWPIRHREIIHEPMLEAIEIAPFLKKGAVERVVCGGESGPGARLCDFEWILNTREQCLRAGVDFTFKQTGARFRKEDRIYAVPRPQQIPQARKAGLDLDFQFDRKG